MPFYRIYQEVPETHVMVLRGNAPEQRLAVKAANALHAGRPVPVGTFPDTGVQGVVTGVPVWVRNRPGRLTVMVTEHESHEEAQTQESAVAESVSKRAE